MNNPNRLLLVLHYLWTTTDFEHPATIKEIISFLEKNGITATRKTIAGDIEDLRAAGIEIDCQRSTQNRYYIETRLFELPEVKLLVDAVQSARFITTKKSKTLIKKLSSFVSQYQGDVLKRQLYVDSRTKAKNESVFYVVDNIHTAIRTKKKVTFQYLEYNQKKEKVLSEETISFDVFDDIVIRRLVECIRVMKDRKIVVILKGGLQAEESF